MQKLKKWDRDTALRYLSRWCAEQDRCHYDARTKLIQHQIYGEELEEIIAELITDDFLNEERYAKAYARGKYRIKKWGRQKILQGLKMKQISAYCIRKAMEEIDDELYEENIKSLIERKLPIIKENNPYKRKHKLSSYLLQKGYDYGEIKDIMYAYFE